ncbi:MAG: hypothetical protein AAF598_13960 [Bacteroidota bacterium]
MIKFEFQVSLIWLIFLLQISACSPIDLPFDQLNTARTEYGLTISPDQKTLYFVRTDSFYTSTKRSIYYSHRKNKQWSIPTLASFSGDYSDSSPFISPDGKYLWFSSNRPVNGHASQHSNIWRIALEEGLPAEEPVYLNMINDTTSSTNSPSVDLTGNLYFGSTRKGGQGWGDLWVARYHDGHYQNPVNLGPTLNTRNGEWGSCISPDGQFLIFENSGNEQNQSPAGDLYLSYKINGEWQSPIHLQAPWNSFGSDLTPKIHGTYLYFASNRTKPGGLFDLNDVDILRLPLTELPKH